MIEMKKYYVCKTIRLMEYLIRKGHNILRVQQNNEVNDRVVFIFKYSDKLDNDVNAYYRRVNNDLIEKEENLLKEIEKFNSLK